MAENKKGFMLYADLIFTVEKLTDEDAGQLLKHILNYVNDRDPIATNYIIDLVFEPIKQTLKRDLKKWETRAERSRSNGSKGGRPKNPVGSKETQKTQRVISKPRKPDSVNVSVSDNVINIYRAFAHLCLSEDEFKKLNADYSKEVIDEVLDEIENYKQNKKYKSLFLTAKNWLKKRKVEPKLEPDWIDNFEEIFKL